MGLAVVFDDEEKSLVDSDRDGQSPTMFLSLVIGHNLDAMILGPTVLMALLEPKQNAEATDAIIMLAVQTLNILSISFLLLLLLLMVLIVKLSTMNPRKASYVVVNLSLSPEVEDGSKRKKVEFVIKEKDFLRLLSRTSSTKQLTPPIAPATGVPVPSLPASDWLNHAAVA